jgi:hypothetical protein
VQRRDPAQVVVRGVGADTLEEGADLARDAMSMSVLLFRPGAES